MAADDAARTSFTHLLHDILIPSGEGCLLEIHHPDRCRVTRKGFTFPGLLRDTDPVVYPSRLSISKLGILRLLVAPDPGG
mgnify:CR=1 FL=1